MASEMARNSSANRPLDRLERRKRSRIADRSPLAPAAPDRRSSWVRRCQEVMAEHIVDLGGADNCSAAERSLIRRAAVMTVELERLEAKFALAEQADANDLELYQRTAANLRRLLQTVGLRRRARELADSQAEQLNRVLGYLETAS
jgi:hypothetical protein